MVLENAQGQVLRTPEGANYLQVLILTPDDPAKVCRRVWCVEEGQ